MALQLLSLSHRLRSLIYITVVLSLFAREANAVVAQKPVGKTFYKSGQLVPVTCVQRSTETGEHISNEDGVIQYMPFPVCNETQRPLELKYGVDQDISCTIKFISDDFYHLLEYYVHHDAPLACRVPSRPLGGEGVVGPVVGSTSMEVAGEEYTSLVFALLGTLQKSHLHISSDMNVILHSSLKKDPKSILAASAYSTSPLASARKVIIGDSLPLKLSVRWFEGTQLKAVPSSGSGAVLWNLFLIAAVVTACYSGYKLYLRKRGTSYKSYPGSGPYGYGFPHGYGMPVSEGGLGSFNYNGGSSPSSGLQGGLQASTAQGNGGGVIGKRD